MNMGKWTTATLIGLYLTIAFFSVQTIYAGEKTNSGLNLTPPDADHIQILTTVDGSTHIGKIVKKTANEIEFKTDLMTVTIPISKVKKIKQIPISSMRNGEYWFANPNTTRLYFAPTARMLKKGKGYFSDYYIFFPGVAYGITDNITIGGGISLFPGVSMKDQLFYFLPKVGTQITKRVNLAVGALVAKVPSADITAGILYGVGTYGTTETSITAGVGYGFVYDDDDSATTDKPMLMLGAEKRLLKHLALVTENWLFPGIDQPLGSYGIRLFGEKLSVDLAFFTPLGEDYFFPGLPYIDFVFHF